MFFDCHVKRTTLEHNCERGICFSFTHFYVYVDYNFRLCIIKIVVSMTSGDAGALSGSFTWIGHVSIKRHHLAPSLRPFLDIPGVVRPTAAKRAYEGTAHFTIQSRDTERYW